MRAIISFHRKLQQPVDILPLVVFRIAFGALMCISTLRFMSNGWIDALYIQPKFHFTYLGFEWIRPLNSDSMLLVFVALVALSLLIMIGLAYRVSALLFFLLFTYVELIDQATYLNHYYFISLVSFLLIFLPAHRYLSFDVLIRPQLETAFVPRWCIFVIQLQLVIVFGFAGLAKLNGDWLLHGLPMKIWLRANVNFPVFGPLFDHSSVAIVLSWAGALYDLTIPIWLLWRRTRLMAYVTVIIFHLMTALLFPIGVFPYVMIASTLIFFSGAEYRTAFGKLVKRGSSSRALQPKAAIIKFPNYAKVILVLFYALQLLMPLRHVLYPGNSNWTMEGYRFAWRVMLNEKAGHATFRVVDRTLGKEQIIYASQHLTDQQVRHMSYQPDMILQFAHYLADHNAFDPQHDIAVYAEVYVSHNGRQSKLLIDPQQNLLDLKRTLLANSWILRY